MLNKFSAKKLTLLSAAAMLVACGVSTAPPADTKPLDTTNKVADFSKTVEGFTSSHGHGNGGVFNVEWRSEEVAIANNQLTLSIEKNSDGATYPYKGGEYRSEKFFGYGDYGTRMKPSAEAGTCSTFFLYTGEWDSETLHPSSGNHDTRNPDNPDGVHDEIDIEFLGKDTTKVQFNYFTKGQGGHEFLYNLGFDASKEFHDYGFRWEKERIIWFVDGKAVYQATTNIPSHPGRIISNYWCGTWASEGWMGKYNATAKTSATYQWFSATGSSKETHKSVEEPSLDDSTDPTELDAIDLSLLNADDVYTVAIADDKKSADITYTNVGKETYKSVIFDIPQDSRSSNKAFFQLENKGSKKAVVRVDVNKASKTASENSTSINVSATQDGNTVYTDTEWGGSKFEIDAGAKVECVVNYVGTPVNFMLMPDSAIYQDPENSHAGHIVLSNLKFNEVDEPTTSEPEASSVEDVSTGEEEVSIPTIDIVEGATELTLLDCDPVYTVNMGEGNKYAEISYSNVGKETYKNLSFDVAEGNRRSDKVSFDLINLASSSSEVRVDINKAAKAESENTTAINVSATQDGSEAYTDTTWGGSKFTLGAKAKIHCEISYSGTPVNFMMMLDSAIYQDAVASHSGHVILANVVYNAIDPVEDSSAEEESSGEEFSFDEGSKSEGSKSGTGFEPPVESSVEEDTSEAFSEETSEAVSEYTSEASSEASSAPTMSVDDEAADLVLTGAAEEYEVAIDEGLKFAEISYDSVAKQSYKNLSFAVAEENRSAATVSFEIANLGDELVNVRLDVKDADNASINVSASQDGSGVYTDLTWGGSFFAVASGETISCEVSFIGTPLNLMLMIDSAIGDDTLDSHSGDILFGNVVYSGEQTVEEEGILFEFSGSPYSCTNVKGSSTITYESVSDNSYASVVASVDAGEANTLEFDVKNNGAENVQLYISLGKFVDGNHVSVLSNSSSADWFNASENRTQINVSPSGSRQITLEWEAGAEIENMMIFINSTYADPGMTHTDGNIVLSGFAFSAVA